jgi:5-oxoprolinase (ATP-hydrolysing)
MTAPQWQFFIDVGGTFTDVMARRPDERLVTHKLLSSGAVRGKGVISDDGRGLVDKSRAGEPSDFWVGYRLRIFPFGPLANATDHGGVGGIPEFTAVNVLGVDASAGRWTFDPALTAQGGTGVAYELRSEEEAPAVAIRRLMGLRLHDPIGPVEVRLGTTRATNALLERKGARVAFVTTKGFGDVLKIGYQDRPELFKLDIRKRDELAETVIEIDERLDARGKVLVAPDEQSVRHLLEAVRATGIEAVAICLLHSHVNPAHDELVAKVAESVGFPQVSVSSRISRLERIVPRGDTTVVDAYLSGVIRGYAASLRQSMPEARVHLMTSSGGLIESLAAGGKDTILSGPAGGVVGCALVSRAAGFDRVIGFDMGGTSTDVSRIEPPPGGFEYQHETVKAGVRIMTPMLAVETVAAGGGSVCAFDGQKLRVGPHSAGADPGPACYGRGGPLTVTDMNLLLGRVAADHFPFQLDRTAVERRAAALCDEVNAATGSSLTPIGLAEGFVTIANANMAAAIRRISIARGYDAREYVLTTFGGAGGQHACAIARMLGISRVLCNPYAGVLSALGIGVADVKRIGERSVNISLSEEAFEQLDGVFAAMAVELRRSLAADGVDSASIAEPQCSLDVCYAGQSTVLTVTAGSVDEARGEFERQHRQQYGYCHEGREMEVRVARVELTARSKSVDSFGEIGAGAEVALSADGSRGLPARRDFIPPAVQVESDPAMHTMVVDGGPRKIPLYSREQLAWGMVIGGPAIIIEDTSTIVVDSGWRAEVCRSGDIVLTDTAAAETRARVSTQVDPIQLELFNNQFAAIAEQMGVTLRRTALSTNVKERLDFSCAIFTPRGDLVVNAPHIPVHLGGMSDCVKCLIDDVGRFEPGDVYVTNDPFRGGSHLNDVTVITPVHDERSGDILFFVASRAHHAEIGGKRPGSMPPDSTCLAEEGVLIRAFRWIYKGRACGEKLRALLASPPHPSRSPDENLADIAAQVAANQTGARDLRTMVSRYGVEVVHAYMDHIQAAAETKMRDAIRRMPDGVRRFEDRLDDPGAPGPIRLTLTISGDSATLDFTGTGPVLRGNLNANQAIVTSAVLYCLRCLIGEDIPLNAGVLAPIKIILPNCFLNPTGDADPRKCPAVAGGNVETSQRVVDTIFGALGVVAASQGTMNNLLMGNERFGYYETICGGAGAGPTFDGADAVHTHMTNTRLTDPEVLESRYPVRLIRFAIRHGSGGVGRFRGGCGVVREFEFSETLDVSIISQRRTVAPYGMGGGGNGQPGRNVLRRNGTDAEEILPPIASVSVGPGDRLTIETPGGGAWGTKDTANHEDTKAPREE